MGLNQISSEYTAQFVLKLYHLKTVFILGFSLCLFSLSACNQSGSSNDDDEDVPFHVGKGLHLNIKNIHSGHKKDIRVAKKRRLPWGAPLTDCKVNKAIETVIDSEKTVKKYTNLNDKNDHIRRKLMSYAKPRESPFYGYRWGERSFEVGLSDKSYSLLSPFDIFNINFGASASGAGLYMDSSPIGSFQYALSTYHGAWEKGEYDRKAIMLTTVIVPQGTLYLEENRLKSEEPSLWSEITGDLNKTTKQKIYPAPLLVSYDASSLSGNKLSDWYVLKTAEEVVAKEFDGQEFSTDELLQFEKELLEMDFRYFTKNHREAVRQYYRACVENIRSKRTYKPGIQEVIPYPPTALYPASVWGRFKELRHCIGAKIPHPMRDRLYYYWRYNGTCGGYADREAHYLVVDPAPPSNRDHDYDALSDPENQACIRQFPPSALWVKAEKDEGYFCRDVIGPLNRNLKKPLYYDAFNYIILGIHENKHDCGANPGL